jgi:hypothetical protein
MQTTLDLPSALYNQAKRVATAQGVSVEEFIARAIEQTLRIESKANLKQQHVRLPLVPSSQPGKVPLTAERLADILSEEDVSS